MSSNGTAQQSTTRRRRCLERIKSENSIVLSWMQKQPDEEVEDVTPTAPLQHERKSSLRRNSLTSHTSSTGEGSLRSTRSATSCLRSSNSSSVEGMRRKSSVQFATNDSVHEYPQNSTSRGILYDEKRRNARLRNRIPEITNIVVKKRVNERTEKEEEEFFDAVETHQERRSSVNDADSIVSSTATPPSVPHRRSSISSVSTLTSMASASVTTLSTESTDLRSPTMAAVAVASTDAIGIITTTHQQLKSPRQYLPQSLQQQSLQSLQARKARRKQPQLF